MLKRSVAGHEIKGRRLLWAACLLFFLPLLAGCAGAKGPSTDSYFKVLERWSRADKVFEGLESRLYINATYKTEEFRKSYIEHYSKSYELSEEHSRALMEREVEQGQAYNEFFFSAYTPESSLNDFERKDSVWQLYIEDAQGRRAKPLSITALENPEPVIREFFPYFDLWSRAYTVRFPKYADSGDEITPEKGDVKLIVTGVMGKGELKWSAGK